ncbi:hypothetical protein BDY21DRAFT_369846 [Lineolata rhizophorae]|uniref:Uncharacterized protein n=1 Tax=Lineolata rhizophorae TaxID=578093 RepID=A0A6A6P7H1_9PEZI|nr:hypothetical protein BDY21DRAFT_369846 [Lineolata rhizophorae]
METEEQRQLQKEIDHLQKLIESNKNKSSEAAQQGVPRRPASAHPAVANNPHSSSAHSTYNPHRIVSYGHGFGRGRIERYRPPVHRNLSLVLNHPGGAAGPSSGAGDDTTSSLPKGFSTLASVGKPPPVHFRSSPPTPTRTPAPAAARSNHEVTIDGLRFCVVDGGSRLLRVVDNNADPTPATAVVAGVNFIRGNDGNLYKANVKAANS